MEGDLATTEHGLSIAKNSWKELKTLFLEARAPPVSTITPPQSTTEPTEVAPEPNVLIPEPATDMPIPSETIIASVVGDLATMEAPETTKGIILAEGIEETDVVGAAEKEITTEGRRTTEVMAATSSTSVDTTTLSDALIEDQAKAAQVPNPSLSADPAN